MNEAELLFTILFVTFSICIIIINRRMTSYEQEMGIVARIISRVHVGTLNCLKILENAHVVEEKPLKPKKGRRLTK